MASSLAVEPVACHRLSLENVRPRMAKADLKFDESREFQAEIGRCLGRALSVAGLTSKEAAALMAIDPAQLSRWIAGTENVQTAKVMRPVELRMPFVEALARWAGASVDVTIRFGRTA